MQSAANQLSLFSDADEPDNMSGFSVRESGRAKRLSIKVFPRGRVEVVVPRRTQAKVVREFVESHAEWIQKARRQFAAEHPPEPFALPVSVDLRGIGRRYLVRYVQQAGSKAVKFRASGDTLILSGNTHCENACIDALKRWLISLAKKEYLPVLTALSVRTDNQFRKMHVRGQRTCWGSHSSSGTISLNYCLMFLTPAHLRYVMIHELCHARQMNHSKRFWSLVSRHEPNYKKLDKDLNSGWKRIPTWVGIY